MTNNIIDRLLDSDEPSVRFKILVNVLGEKLESSEIIKIREEVRTSPRVRLILSERGKDGKIPFHPYKKWYGAHWVLATLADIGYPSGDKSLVPLRQQVYGWFYSKKHEMNIKTMKGLVRRCASQEGNALYYLLTLGLADNRTQELAERLIKWQWPDGGWNCDKKPEAKNSSFFESLIPFRALTLHTKVTGNEVSKKAAERAAEIFLKRRLYKRQRDGSVIKDGFTKLHYPCYFGYDILFGLKVMAETGFIDDGRCADALNLLESKRLPDGGFPAEERYYRVTQKKAGSRCSLVNWGGVRKKRMNEFVTADALYVLKKSGRLI